MISVTRVVSISVTGVAKISILKGPHLVGITEQEHSLQSLDTKWLQGGCVKFHKGLGWMDHRLDSVVKDVWDGLLLLG